MEFLKKAISVACIIVIAFIDLKIIVDYKIIGTKEKYDVIKHKKTVAKILDLSNVHPKEALEQDTLEEASEPEISEEELIAQEPSELLEESVMVAQSFEALDIAFSEVEEELAPAEDFSLEAEEVTEELSQIESTQEQELVSYESSDSANSIVDTALQYVGYSYVSGGSSPETGFDCSGFTKYIYGLYGIELNRVSGDQAYNGTPISREDLQPGDLVLFSYYGSDSIGHSAIYIGNGEIVHAANSSRGVTIDTIESGYYDDNYVTARRVN